MSCRSRAEVGSDCGKGSRTVGQVGDGKTNVVGPLLSIERINDVIETRVGSYPWENGAPLWSISRGTAFQVLRRNCFEKVLGRDESEILFITS